MRSTMHGFYSPATADTRLRQVRHVAEPLGNCIYGFPRSRPHQNARESARSAHQRLWTPGGSAGSPSPKGLETDSS